MKTAKAENRPPSQGGTGNYIKRKSVIPGVTITQFVEELPDGCSAPDFERRPIPLTIQEGKTATFKAVVKGSPMPEVRWARAKGELGDADKYKMTYDRGINEHTLQVIKADPDDADSYRCFATNEYGEAMCAAVLIIIEVGFKKKAKKPTMEQDVGKSDPQDFRKMLKKRAPPPVQKQEKAVDEKVWELLMNADKKDYEKICLDHGITDFRWMLKKLQEMKKEQQDQQQQYVKEVIKLRHVEVNPEEGASFEVEMDLKNPNSKIYIYKDGELIQYSFDSGRKHYLRQLGKKYSFHVNDLEDSDAGIYKMTVEDVTIFTTELELMMIPVNFSSKLKELYCKEWDNAVFECTLTQPFPKVMWLFKGQPLTDSNKYEMSVSPDGLTHRLVVKEVRPVDKGGYTILAGIRSSSAWLNVEIEGDGDLSLRKRRKLGEEAGEENKGLQSGQVDYTDKENLRNLQKESSGADQDGLRAGEGDDLYGRGKGGKGGSGEGGDLYGRGKGGKGGYGEEDDLYGRGKGGKGGSGEGDDLYGRGKGGKGGSGEGDDLYGRGKGGKGGSGEGDDLYGRGKGGKGGSGEGDDLYGRGKGGKGGSGEGEDLLGRGKGGKGGSGEGEDLLGRGKGGKGGSGEGDDLLGRGKGGKGGSGEGEDLLGRGKGGKGGSGEGEGLLGRGKGGKGGSGEGDDLPGRGKGGKGGSGEGEDLLGRGKGGKGGSGEGEDLLGRGKGGKGGSGEGEDLLGRGKGGKGGSGEGEDLLGRGKGGKGGSGEGDDLLGRGKGGKGGSGEGDDLHGRGKGGKGGSGEGEDLLGRGKGGKGGSGEGDDLHGRGKGGKGGSGEGEDLLGRGKGGKGGSGEGDDLHGRGKGGKGGSGEGDDLLGRGKGGKGGSGEGDLLGRGKGGKGGSGDLDGKGMGGIGGQDGPSGSNKDGRKGLQDSPLSGLRGSGKDDGSQWGASAGDGKDSLAGLHGAGKGEQSGLQDGLDGSGKDASRGLHGSLGGSGANQGGLNDREGLSGKDGSGASGQGKGSRDTNLKSRLGSGSGINEADGGDKYGKGELGVKGGLFAGDSDGLQDKSAALGVSNLSDGSDALAGGEGKMLGDRSGDRMTAGHGKGSSYGGQASGQDGLAGAGLQDGTDFGDAGLGGKGSSQRGQRGEKLDLEGSGDLADQNLKNKDRRAGANLQRDKPKEPACRVSSGLADVQAGKGQAAEFCCMLTDDKEEGTWFKNGAKISSQEGLTIRKEGSVHKLVIDCVQDTDSGKYRFEVMGLKCEAELYVEDPPAVDQDLLKKLAKEPLVVKAGHTVAVKVPFEGRQPIRASWYKDGDELVEDSRIRLEKAGNYARLSISKCSRKDSGDLKLKLKNESGVIEANMKITVLDKPLPPQGPVEVLENSATQISIKWKPPRDDGGRPVQHYTVEKQQVGRNTWLKVGEVNKGITTFTTDKVEHGKKYIFKIQAVSSEGISEPLKSDEVMAGTKAFPGAPDPPRIADTSSKSISLTWVAPQNTGGSRLVGYLVEKRKKGSSMWMEVNKELIPERKFTVTDVMEGLQYEFRVTAVNTSGPGEPSSPSEAVFAREPMKPPGQVKGLKLSDSSYTSISLQWGKPDSEEGGEVEGYFVEVRSGKEINWRQCNISPIRATNYTINDLEAMELYFLRVIAINDGGLGKPRELGTYVLAMPPPVRPRFTLDSGWKRYMTVKAGSSIRVNIPFQASPTPEVFWLKDNISLSKRATITNSEGISQLLIPSSERIDSGMYTIVLKSYFGQESFSFEIRVTDIPRPPGPIRLDENVPKTVTVSWDASPDEKHDDRLHYLVMKRDTDNMSWHMVTDLIFNNKYTVANIIPGHKYYFRVMAKNDMGVSDASETQEPWIIFREKDKFTMREPHYRKVDQSQAPRILVGLKPHVVLSGCDCCMSCAVRGSPKPQVTWYHNNKDVTEDPAYWSSDISGVCSLVICCVTSKDSGEYKVIAQNPLGKAVSSSRLIVTERDIPLSAAL
ncbi:immunoglobulin-like and fibronectin type III domain-containing protein 1 [Latimeria chalumnae]|uniref:immunoglobulin-like and fibronectin type III domain-containing protein 1 n=1 Tax=Latimeria chalumnae TaxID=7897 RepID=UPI00313C36FB